MENPGFPAAGWISAAGWGPRDPRGSSASSLEVGNTICNMNYTVALCHTKVRIYKWGPLASITHAYCMNDFGPVEILVGLIKSMNGTPNGSYKKRNTS